MSFEIVDHNSTEFVIGTTNMVNACKIILITAEFDYKLEEMTGLGDQNAVWFRNGFLTVTGQVIATTLGNTLQSTSVFDEEDGDGDSQGLNVNTGSLSFRTDTGFTCQGDCVINKASVEMRFNTKGVGRVPASWTYTMSNPDIS